MTAPCDLSAVAARRLIGARALSPVELMQSCLDRIAAVDPALNAIVTLDPDAALADARAAEAAVMRGDALGPLHGLPLAAKDNRATRGMRTTHGSLIFKDAVPEEDEPGMARLRAAGAVIFAKTNLPEFGAGANSTNRLFGPTGNPFDPARTCAGSSGGSAVALATGMAPLATGSDYGGSVRTPAAFCGIAGFRPSLGVAPLPGAAAVLSPFGVNGAMGRDMADTHLLTAAMAVHDPRDPFSHPGVAAVADPIRPADLSSLRVAASVDLGCAPIAQEIAAVFEERLAGFGGLFGRLERAHPDMGEVHDVFEVTRGVAFVAAHRDHLDNRRELLDRNVIDNCERGLEYSLGDVARAQAEQARIYRRWHAFFEKHDVLIAPAASVSPFPHSELFVSEIDGMPMPTYMRWLAITYAPTMAFATAAVLPCGLDAQGMPFGIQVLGPMGADRKVLAAAMALEQALAGIEGCARPLPDLARLAEAAR
ncbi:amidase family protein [Paralimibaculum aggregatum]|uniref:Amidase family protein n=1 Tax=Paralimibaculum aggregatum TaxID=3036245 RepID=A0ABQ6LRE6_9RHOB|nr:amidase family protein [Limibaculum sp. NKW23]GMG83721.1 amidase family protein [Limibaculum sp. NKW23]